MYSAVHADRSGRVLISAERGAAAMGGTEAIPFTAGVPLPEGAEVVPLEREAIAFDKGGRARPLGKDRLALAALVPGWTRLLFPAYVDDPAAPPLTPRPYVAVAANERGELVAALSEVPRKGDAKHAPGPAAVREHPANALARQLARCARDHACAAARAGIGRGDLPVPLGAPAAERPRLPLDLRSSYDGSPTERAAFRPTAREIAEVAATHLDRGGPGVAFGRACDGEPLARIRVLEQAISLIKERSPRARIHLETCGSDAASLGRVAEAGLTSVTIRLASARADTFATLHGPVAHRWSDVRASLQVAAERGLDLAVALLVHPGITDRPAELDAIVALLWDLPGGRVELRDLGGDPLRVGEALPRARPLGMRAALDRLAELDHFRRVRAPAVTV